ncbi:MAG: patatin family protein [Bacteroidaceae bacterium]|nr:patatin family protein [Bacteroidaceae bacterium]
MTRKTVKITPASGLILEGGGMRGVFTSGVLDNFMDRGIRFPYTIGVSAGACNGLSYMSGQRGRAKYCNIDLLEKHHYIGFKHLLFKGNIMDFDLLFKAIPERIYPYDFEAYTSGSNKFEMVTTCCTTGKPCYFEERNSPDRVIEIVRASSSLPFVSPIASVDGLPMMDGGVADSIPLLRARKLGYNNNVVVLTRNKGYRKPDKKTMVPFFMYRKYPALREAIRNRNEMYNKQIALVEELEDAGKVTVVRPESPIIVGRMERDTSKLLDLYNEGYKCAANIAFEINNI